MSWEGKTAPLSVELDGEGRPAAFLWQDRRHLVTRISHFWQDLADDRRLVRDYWQVLTDTQLLTHVYYDYAQENWGLWNTRKLNWCCSDRMSA